MYNHLAAARQSALNVSYGTENSSCHAKERRPASDQSPWPLRCRSLFHMLLGAEAKALEARPTTTRQLVSAFNECESRLE